jgi:transketolase
MNALSNRATVAQPKNFVAPRGDDHEPIRRFARQLREDTLHMVARSNTSHVGTCLSMADLLACLYGGFLRVDAARPDWPDRDRFFLSKGHGVAILYAALAERGFFPRDWLATYAQEDSLLTSHPNHVVPGIELATGSLGHGLPVACGLALAAQRAAAPWRTVVLMSDGELDEGSNWEAFLFAAHHRLDNLIAVIDYNKIQSLGHVRDVLDLEPLADKLRAFRWAVREIDGHDLGEIGRALDSRPWEPGRPHALLAHTVKGKGVSFMEDKLAWHYKSPNGDQLAQALRELEEPA